MPTREEYERGISRAQAAGDNEAAQVLIKRAREEMMKGQGGLVENLGAGMANVVQGARQIIPGLSKPSDEEIKEKRELDAALARSTTGGGLAQVAGEILPSLVIPGGAGARVLTRALGGAGGAAGRVGMPAAMGGAALESAGATAFLPTTSDESRLGNIAVGGAMGAGAPLLVKALGAGGRAAGRFAEKGMAAIPEHTPLVGGMGARAAARIGGRETAEALERGGVPMQPGRYAAQDYQPQTRAPREFEPTTAAAYHQTTPALAPFETAARGMPAAAPSWAARDVREAGKRWEHLGGSLRGEADIDAALGRADQLAPPYQAISPRRYADRANQFAQELEQAATSAAYRGNPAVRAAVDQVRAAFREGMPDPQTLHELQKTLRKGLTGAPGLGEAGVRAASKEPYIISLADRINDVMEGSTYARSRGAWDRWRQNYAGEMGQAEGAKAEERLRRAFVDEAGQPLRGTGDVPPITAPALKQTATKLRTPTTGPRRGENIFSQQANQAVADVVQDLEAAGVVERVRQAATLGNSSTAYNLTTGGITGVLADLMLSGGMGTLMGGAAGGLTQTLSRANIAQAKQRIMTEIMQDPAQFRAFVQAAADRTRQLAGQRGLSARAQPYGAIAAGAAVPALEGGQ